MKTCPACGSENRDTAKFCAICGMRLPSIQSKQPLKSPAQSGAGQLHSQSPGGSNQAVKPTVIDQTSGTDPAQLVPSSTIGSQPVKSRSSPRWSFPRILYGSRPIVEGRVSVVDPLRDAKLPYDSARAMTFLGIALLLLGLCAATAVVALALFIVLAFLGAGSICILPFILPFLAGLTGWFFYGVRGSRICPMVDFMVQDELTGQPMSVIIYLKEGSGSIRLEDRVRVYGTKQWNTKSIRAYRIEIVESGGYPTNFTLRGVRPWPLWVGVTVLVGVIVFYIWLFMGGYLPQV